MAPDSSVFTLQFDGKCYFFSLDDSEGHIIVPSVMIPRDYMRRLAEARPWLCFLGPVFVGNVYRCFRAYAWKAHMAHQPVVLQYGLLRCCVSEGVGEQR